MYMHKRLVCQSSAGKSLLRGAGRLRQSSAVSPILLQLHSHHHHDLVEPVHCCGLGEL